MAFPFRDLCVFYVGFLIFILRRKHMTSLNKVMLMGNLGKDPEAVKSDKSFTRISMATMKKYRNNCRDLLENTQWHTVYFNGTLAKAALEHLKKGSKIYIEGELRTTEWTKDNVRQFSTAVYASELKFLSAKPPDAEAT